MNNTLETDYLKYLEQVKQIKYFYDKRKNQTILSEIKVENNIIPKKNLVEEKKKEFNIEDDLKNIIISIDGEKHQFLEKKRNLDKNYN